MTIPVLKAYKYNNNDGVKIKFRHLLENEIAEQEGLSKMTMDEIKAEIKAVRDAKTHS